MLGLLASAHFRQDHKSCFLAATITECQCALKGATVHANVHMGLVSKALHVHIVYTKEQPLYIRLKMTRPFDRSFLLLPRN